MNIDDNGDHHATGAMTTTTASDGISGDTTTTTNATGSLFDIPSTGDLFSELSSSIISSTDDNHHHSHHHHHHIDVNDCHLNALMVDHHHHEIDHPDEFDFPILHSSPFSLSPSSSSASLSSLSSHHHQPQDLTQQQQQLEENQYGSTATQQRQLQQENVAHVHNSTTTNNNHTDGESQLLNSTVLQQLTQTGTGTGTGARSPRKFGLKSHFSCDNILVPSLRHIGQQQQQQVQQAQQVSSVHHQQGSSPQSQQPQQVAQQSLRNRSEVLSKSVSTPLTPTGTKNAYSNRINSGSGSCGTPNTPGSAKRKISDFTSDPPSKNPKRAHHNNSGTCASVGASSTSGASAGNNGAVGQTTVTQQQQNVSQQKQTTVVKQSPTSQVNQAVDVVSPVNTSSPTSSSLNSVVQNVVAVAPVRASHSSTSSLNEPFGEQHYARIYHLTSQLEMQTSQVREKIVKSVISTRQTWEHYGMEEKVAEHADNSKKLVSDQMCQFKTRQKWIPVTKESASTSQEDDGANEEGHEQPEKKQGSATEAQAVVIDTAIDAEDVLNSMIRNTLNFFGNHSSTTGSSRSSSVNAASEQTASAKDDSDKNGNDSGVKMDESEDQVSTSNTATAPTQSEQLNAYFTTNRDQVLNMMCADHLPNGSQVLDYSQLRNQVLCHEQFAHVYSGLKTMLDQSSFVSVNETELVNKLMHCSDRVRSRHTSATGSVNNNNDGKSKTFLIEMKSQDAMKAVHFLSTSQACNNNNKVEASSSPSSSLTTTTVDLDMSSLANIQIPSTIDTSVFVERFEHLQRLFSQEMDVIFQTQMYWLIKYDTVLNEHAIVRHVTQYERDYINQTINIKFQLLTQQLKEKYQEKVLSLKDLLLIKTRRRGNLPKHATNILKKWLFDHFLQPYPTEADKIRLSQQTQLTLVQISNWFINARVRTWRPMLESMLNGDGKSKTKNDPQLKHLQNLTPSQITAALNNNSSTGGSSGTNGQETPKPQTEAPCNLPQ